MEGFAAWLGVFIGRVLKECAPQLAAILAEGIKRAMQNTVEDGRAPADLRDSLLDQLHADDSGPTGSPGSDSQGGQG